MRYVQSNNLYQDVGDETQSESRPRCRISGKIPRLFTNQPANQSDSYHHYFNYG